VANDDTPDFPAFNHSRKYNSGTTVREGDSVAQENVASSSGVRREEVLPDARRLINTVRPHIIYRWASIADAVDVDDFATRSCNRACAWCG